MKTGVHVCRQLTFEEVALNEKKNEGWMNPRCLQGSTKQLELSSPFVVIKAPKTIDWK